MNSVFFPGRPALFLLASLLWPVCGAAETGGNESAPRTDDAVLLDEIRAVVNNGIVLQSELDNEIRFLQLQARVSGQQLTVDEPFRLRVLDRLIAQQLQQQRAAQLGIDVDQSSINAAIERVATGNNLSTQAFRKALQQQGFDFNHYRESVKRELLLDRLIQAEVTPVINLSEREINDFVASSASSNKQYHLRHILVAAPSSSSPEALAEARASAVEARKQLLDGASFSDLAARISAGRRALEGGDLGWRKLSELPVFLHAPLKDLSQGELSEPIQSPNGFHLIRVDGVRNTSAELVTETLIRHIFLARQPQRSAEVSRLKLLEVRARVSAGESFSDLAEEISEDPNSASNGGELPWFAQGEMPPEIEQAAASLAQNEISDPLETSYGWHLIQMLDKRTHDRLQERIRREAELNLRQRKLESETENWSRRLRSEAFVEIRD